MEYFEILYNKKITLWKSLLSKTDVPAEIQLIERELEKIENNIKQIKEFDNQYPLFRTD